MTDRRIVPVRIRDTYTSAPSSVPGGAGAWQGQEFFAIVPGLSSASWPTLILHESDTRRGDAWSVPSYSYSAEVESLGLEPSSHYGWHVQESYVTVLEEATPEPTPTPEPYTPTVGERVTITAGADWSAYPDPDTIVGLVGTVDSVDVHDANRHVLVRLEPGQREVRTVPGDLLDRLWVKAVAPLESTPEPEPEPWKPAVGDRVRVTSDRDTPEQNGKAATLLEVRDTDRYSPYRVRYDSGSHSHTAEYGWWVAEVAPLMPASEEEFTRLLEEARVKGHAAGLEEGKRQGKEEADRVFTAWKEEATRVAHEYAQNNSLCREFDKCMVAIGLEPRESFTRSATVEITYTVHVDIPGTGDESDAEEIALERIREGDPYGYLRTNVEVELEEVDV